MFEIVDKTNNNTRTVDTRAEAENAKADLESLGSNVEIRNLDSAEPDGGDADVIEADSVDLPDSPPIDRDPVDWLPQHFVDTIQGVPTLNRKGYAVMCERYGVEVSSTPVTLASSTEFEYAEFKAVARTKDGREYSGFGSAHVDRKDGDDKHLLNELAETRAMKRAAAWATGVGMTAAVEMENTL